jgi:hypothetical protein
VIPVTGAFGSVYWAHADVQSKLGAPASAEFVVNASELGFQRGTMYERLDNDLIYVLLATNTWSTADDTWTSADPPGGGPGPAAGLYVPAKGFGKAWSADKSVADALGYAVKPEGHVLEGRVQGFAHGLMLYSDQGFVYVLYSDGTWKLYPDASGHGDLLTPTPEPSATATPGPAATATPESRETSTPAANPTATPATPTTPTATAP